MSPIENKPSIFEYRKRRRDINRTLRIEDLEDQDKSWFTEEFAITNTPVREQSYSKYLTKSIKAIRKKHRQVSSSQESTSQSDDETTLREEKSTVIDFEEKPGSSSQFDEVESVTTTIEHFSVDRMDSQEELDNQWFQETFQLQNVSPLELSNQQVERQQSIIGRAQKILKITGVKEDEQSASESKRKDKSAKKSENDSVDSDSDRNDELSDAETIEDGQSDDETTAEEISDDSSLVSSDEESESDSETENKLEIENKDSSIKSSQSKIPSIISMVERDNQWFKETFHLQKVSPTDLSGGHAAQQIKFMKMAKNVLVTADDGDQESEAPVIGFIRDNHQQIKSESAKSDITNTNKQSEINKEESESLGTNSSIIKGNSYHSFAMKSELEDSGEEHIKGKSVSAAREDGKIQAQGIYLTVDDFVKDFGLFPEVFPFQLDINPDHDFLFETLVQDVDWYSQEFISDEPEMNDFISLLFTTRHCDGLKTEFSKKLNDTLLGHRHEDMDTELNEVDEKEITVSNSHQTLSNIRKEVLSSQQSEDSLAKTEKSFLHDYLDNDELEEYDDKSTKKNMNLSCFNCLDNKKTLANVHEDHNDEKNTRKSLDLSYLGIEIELRRADITSVQLEDRNDSLSLQSSSEKGDYNSDQRNANDYTRIREKISGFKEKIESSDLIQGDTDFLIDNSRTETVDHLTQPAPEQKVTNKIRGFNQEIEINKSTKPAHVTLRKPAHIRKFKEPLCTTPSSSIDSAQHFMSRETESIRYNLGVDRLRYVLLGARGLEEREYLVLGREEVLTEFSVYTNPDQTTSGIFKLLVLFLSISNFLLS